MSSKPEYRVIVDIHAGIIIESRDAIHPGLVEGFSFMLTCPFVLDEQLRKQYVERGPVIGCTVRFD